MTILPLCQYFAYLEVGREEEQPPASCVTRAICGGPTRPLRDAGAAVRHAAGPQPRRHLPGLPRAVRAPERRRGGTPDERIAADAPALLYQRRRLGFRHDPAHPRRHRGDRRRRARPRRLSEPDRDHHGRADARRLFLDRHAAVLQALVVRQAFRPARGRCTARGCAASPTRSSSTPIPASATSWRRTRRRCRRWSSPMPPSATTTSSRTTTCSAAGRTPTASSTISNSPRTTSPDARSATARPRSSACSTRRMP